MKNRTLNSVDLLRLWLKHCDGAATRDEIAQLGDTIRSRPEMCSLLAGVAQDQTHLGWSLRSRAAEIVDLALPSDGSDSAPNDPLVQIQPPAIWSEGSGSSRRSWASLASVSLAITLIAVGMFSLRSTQLQQPSRPLTPSPVYVAKIQEQHEGQWRTGSVIPDASRLTAGQSLELTSGTVKLAFLGGTTVFLESPAQIELLTDKSLRLEYGTVAVHVMGPKKEFVIVSPDASIVDLGTSFGVHREQGGATEIEVFEGAVEVHPDGKPEEMQVLGIGNSASVCAGDVISESKVLDEEGDRFARLLEFLWTDLATKSDDDSDRNGAALVECEFRDRSVPGTVDTFYNAARGRGWLTPWVAAGNPDGHITEINPLSGPDNPYLKVRFYRSHIRAIARQYGERNGFDPLKPHVITWRWRFDGSLDHFNNDFWDRLYFYSNPYFRRNSWLTNGWLIGVVGGNEKDKAKRRVYPHHWYVFDRKPGSHGADFDRRNMVDTGLSLKANVLYHFAVVVYPEQRKYDVAIRDDDTTFTKTGLHFRDPKTAASNVLHFGACANDAQDDLSFSLDSIRVEPLDQIELLDRVNNDADEKPAEAASKFDD